MTTNLVRYNGYEFNEYSEISVNAVMQDDDSGRTTLYHRYKLRVESTIYAEGEDAAGQAGLHFRRVRDRLSKKGQGLTIFHAGFDDGLFSLNTVTGGPTDVSFGPHPRVIAWEPIGNENAVHVVWECEFCISTCDRWTGIMSLNYGISTRIDTAGYTTRTISGHIEIAMTRDGRNIPDTADAYRDKVIIGRLPNFQREHTWNLAIDKRRADFTIVDTEIRSPNAFPAGVINIQGNHGAGWTSRQGGHLSQTIRATIELAQGQPRSRAWEIFKAIVDRRFQFAAGAGFLIENLYVDESLFSNQLNFALNYRSFMEPNEAILTALPGMFTSTGIGSALNLGTWQQWSTSVSGLQSHRGQANLKHSPESDQIIDLCSQEFLPSSQESARLPYTPPVSNGRKLTNSKPSARKSYLRFETWIDTVEETPSTTQISIDADDLNLEGNAFDPTNPEATLGETLSGSNVVRYIETQSGRIEVIWRGYAERVGYPTPRPDKLSLGGVTLHRVGKSHFRQLIIRYAVGGMPIYGASWNQRYAVSSRPSKISEGELDAFAGT